MYDVFCFLFFFLALLIYLRARLQGRFLGVWGTLGFLACLVCALNSKEMGATLPVMVLVYELIFHPPNFRSLRALIRWCFREGRMALLGALCVLIYLPAKLGSGRHWRKTRHTFRLIPGRAGWKTPATYLGDLLYRNNPSLPLGVTPLSPLRCGRFFRGAHRHRALDALSRGLVRPAVLRHHAAAGLVHSGAPGLRALSAAGRHWRSTPRFAWCGSKKVCAGWSRKTLHGHVPPADAVWPTASVALFIGTALLISMLDFRNWPRAPDPQYSPYKSTIAEFSRLYPSSAARRQALICPQRLGLNLGPGVSSEDVLSRHRTFPHGTKRPRRDSASLSIACRITITSSIMRMVTTWSSTTRTRPSACNFTC